MTSRISESLGSDAGSLQSQLERGALNPGHGVEKVLAVFFGGVGGYQEPFLRRRAAGSPGKGHDDGGTRVVTTTFNLLEALFFSHVHLLKVLLRLHVSSRGVGPMTHVSILVRRTPTRNVGRPLSRIVATLFPVIMYMYIHFSDFCSI